MLTPQTIVLLCLMVGLCMLAGWAVAFRNRPYLGLLGLAFVVLSGYVRVSAAIREAQAAKLPVPLLSWLQVSGLVITVALFAAAVWAAIQESRRRLREMREHFRAAEEAYLLVLEAQRAKKRRDDGKKPE